MTPISISTLWWKPPRWVWLWGAPYVAWIAHVVLDGRHAGVAYATLLVGWVVIGPIERRRVPRRLLALTGR